MREADIQTAILQWLQLLGFAVWKGQGTGQAEGTGTMGIVWRNYVGPVIRGNGFKAPNPAAGTPDIEGITADGRYLGIEVKRPGEPLKPHQENFMRAVGVFTARRAIVIRADSVLDVARQLREVLA